MTEEEKSLFIAFLRRASSYLEFGCGGSTVLAASHVSKSLISVDSSIEWLNQVAAACATDASLTKPTLVLADIGPTAEWGRPMDESCREKWPSYSELVWQQLNADQADLYLVDGRFRVACFLQILLRCKADAVILIHDFTIRKEYHIVRNFAREIAMAGELSAFVRCANCNYEDLRHALERAKYHPG
jgi:hypothetical protein